MSALGSNIPHDPAPSRIKYRLERLWLTPVYKSLIRTGLPIGIVAALAINYLANPDNQLRLANAVENAQAMIEERPEFAVNGLRIDGATDAVREEVAGSIPLEFPVSSMRLDLEDMKDRIEGIPSVQSAVLVLQQGTLFIEVAERQPALVWRSSDQQQLLDTSGTGAGHLERIEDYPHLPLIVGEAADKAVPEALILAEIAAPLGDRVLGLRRVGARRWDVALDRGQLIQLPEQGAAAALRRIVALNTAHDLLNRDVLVVDMRNAGRPTIRLSGHAMIELSRLRALADGEENEI